MRHTLQNAKVGSKRAFMVWLRLNFLAALSLLIVVAVGGHASPTYSPIAYALEDIDKDFIPDHIGRPIKLKGTITFIREVTPSSVQIFVQDDSAGIMVYCSHKPADVAEGDLIAVEGTISQYKGAEEIVNPKITPLGKGPAIAPKPISTTDLNSERFYGQLVQIRGKIASARLRLREDRLLIDDGQNIATIFISKSQRQGIDISRLKEKSVISVTGIAFQYAPDAPYNSGYELLPRRAEDIVVLNEPPFFELKHIAFILISLALISSAALVWIYTLRKTIREKTARLESTQEQLVQAEKLSSIGQIMSGVAHELNNPLCIISGYAQLLQARVKEETVRQDLEKILEGADRASKVVQNLLTFARKRKLEKNPAHINELIERTIDLKAYQLKIDNIEVVRDLDPGILCAEADPYQLQQVFLNIINNAHDAMNEYKEKGKLIIRTEMVEDKIRILFTDDGPGMSKDILKKIFDPFFTTKPVGQGTGLGLSLSYGIIKEHGGHIYVHSKERSGTTFSIELPASGCPPESRAAGNPDLAEAGGKTVQGKRILVVDDESSITGLASAALARKGYNVEACNEGKMALAKVKKGETYHLILTDLKMPGMSGSEFYQRIKEIDPRLSQRVVFITGDVASPETQTFLAGVKNKCIEKPFELTTFVKFIDKELEAVQQ